MGSYAREAILIRLRPLVSRCGLPISLMLLFLAIASHDLTLPGLYGDEVTPITPAIAFAKGLPDWQADGVAATQITIHGHALDLMILRYYGALKTMLFLPVSALFGESTSVIRWFTLLIAAIAVFATYRFTARAFSHSAAFVAALLLALDQGFIFRTKIDWGPNALAITLKMLGLVALLRWWQRGNLMCLVGSGFAFGLALYNKADFSYMLAALVIATLLLYSHEVRRALSLRDSILFVGSLLGGAAIFIWYNLRYPFASFRDGNPSRVAWWHPDVYRTAVQGRFRHLLDLLNGDSMNIPIGLLPRDVRPFPFGTLMGAMFIGAMAIALMIVCFAPNGTGALRRPLAWLMVVVTLFILLCAATPAAYDYHHVINVYPFPHILVGVTFTKGIAALARGRAPRYRRGLLIASVLTLVALVAADIALLRNTYVVLERTGGARQWSDSIYTLADDLSTRPRTVPVHMMDWGIKRRIDVLLEGQTDGIDESWIDLLNEAQAPTTAQDLLKEPQAEYVTYAPGTAVFPAAWAAMQRYAQQQGLAVRVLKTYTQRDGLPTMQLCTFVPSRESPASSIAATGTSADFAVILAIPTYRVDGSRVTFVMWSSGDRSAAQVYVSWPGQPELLFAQGDNGAAPAQFIHAGIRYTFRLYAGTTHRTLLREITVDGDGR